MTRLDYRSGHQLGPGIYACHGELHIDEDEFIRGTGGNPRDPHDLAAARAAIERVCASHNIPTVADAREVIWP